MANPRDKAVKASKKRLGAKRAAKAIKAGKANVKKKYVGGAHVFGGTTARLSRESEIKKQGAKHPRVKKAMDRALRGQKPLLKQRPKRKKK